MQSTASGDRGRVTAVLGPTNTGKTHLAVERMLGHRSGMIGFPLRLLARENYDKIVKAKGRAAVALVTGEEKIVPPGARYFVCTVESMPLDRPVSFLAVDEIQLCADPERGHVFTDRLLHARGMDETMFLGAETIRPLIQKLVRGVDFVTRPRFSQLSYAGTKKLTRLPPRSAVVAFSATDVYSLAELIRRQRGGTAVVLGALSPRTRNAQVGLYQAGEVDYLVATDAIGMGLNMDVDHVAFAKLVKFDGWAPRRLRATEIAQIAGRAGRHMSDGTFGTTADAQGIDEETVERVENHAFEPLTSLTYRNADLRFDSPKALLRSLEMRPDVPELVRVREADDQMALAALAADAEIAGLARNRGAVRLLWEVCQIPDFRKVMSDAHTRLLSQIYRHLMAAGGPGMGGHLPEDWVAGHVARLDRTEGDIDALVARIAHIRTWTYVSHRGDWLADPGAWQERTRAIEDKLSDALHERLTQRFIDRRSALLVRSLQSGAELLGAVRPDGEVLVEGHPVGRIEGLRFILDPEAAQDDTRPLMAAARRVLGGEIARRVRALEQAEDEAFALADDGTLSWTGAPVARLGPGPSVLVPGVVPVHDDLLDGAQRDRLRARLARWVESHVAARLAPLMRLTAPEAAGVEIGGTARGIAFQIAEALGSVARGAVEPALSTLDKSERKALAALGVRFGTGHVFLPALVKPAAVALRALLWAVRNGMPLPPPTPPPGRIAVPTGPAPAGFWEAIGYPPLGPRAVRVDILERFEGELYRRDPTQRLEASPQLAQMIGSSVAELEGVLGALGYRRREEEDGAVTWKRGRGGHGHRRPKPPIQRKGAFEDSPFAKLRHLAGRG
ncbi:helicase-related protein [Arenibaculum sp.]|uniref:helicase-related protein n=1 Tax=Arenibaculum sp. TaxID=2865862 RepID=UPI002E0F92E4|nr:helicase-related protein [Arenibaculum sp.]